MTANKPCPFDPAMKLSPNFTLGEMADSRTALLAGIDNTPDRHQLRALRVLCQQVLQPIRDRFGPVRITSGFRNPATNEAVGGVPLSAHRIPYDLTEEGTRFSYVKVATDFQVPGVPLEDVYDWIRLDSGLSCDQVILERGKVRDSEGDDCIHIAWAFPRNRHQAKRGQTRNAGLYTDDLYRIPALDPADDGVTA